MRTALRTLTAVSLFAMLLIVSSPLAAQEISTIAVLSIDATVISRDEARVFEDYLSSHLVQTGKYRVIDRKQREVMLEEAKFATSGMGDEREQLEIGKLLSAEYIIVGSLGKLGSSIILNLKLIQVETGSTTATASETYRNMDAVIKDSNNLVLSLLGEGGGREKRTVSADGRGSSIEIITLFISRTDDPPDDYEPYPSEWIDYAKPIIGAGLGYTYNFSPRFAVGAFAVARFGNRPYYTDYYDDPENNYWDRTEYEISFPNLGAKIIIGDKNGGFAVSLNPAFPTPSAGVYFRGFFVNVVLPNAWDDSWWAWDGEGFGLEAGYSLYFKSKLVSWMFRE